MYSEIRPWVADGIIVLGVIVMTIGVWGVLTMPDPYTRLHAASKSVFLGVVALAVASMSTGDLDITLRVILIAAILILTTPVSSHVIGRAAFIEGEHMRTAGAIDESGHHLADEVTDDIPEQERAYEE